MANGSYDLAGGQGSVTVGLTILLGGIGFGAWQFYESTVDKNEKQRQIRATRSLVSQAVKTSSAQDGNSRFWSENEKGAFLDYFDIDGVIQPGCEVLFRAEPGYANVFFGSRSDGNGTLFWGDSSKSGTKIGRISDRQFSEYIEANKMKKAGR